MNGLPLTVPASPAQQVELIEIDTEFFTRTMDFPDGNFRIVEKCHYLSLVGARHPIELAERLVVPDECVAAAQAVLAKHHMSLKAEPISSLR